MSSSSNSMYEQGRGAGESGITLRGFPPVGAVGGDARPRFLVLGSFPSVLSLEKREYYANPRNHFWTVAAACLGLPEPRDYSRKIAMLKEGGIALWDVFASCERKGSLDKDIARASPNPIAEFLLQHPSIGAIGANGGAASAALSAELGFPPEGRLARTGDHFFWSCPFATERFVHVFRLPSTSPVPSSDYRTAADKVALWNEFFTIRM
ncbi:MAG: DNA-deoxyinosine glycosylase [Spirochaetales bacterium]